MEKKIYREFWDNFDTLLYSKIVDSKNDVLQIRINDKVKNEFKKNCENKGGMANVITVFINQVNKVNK